MDPIWHLNFPYLLHLISKGSAPGAHVTRQIINNVSVFQCYYPKLISMTPRDKLNITCVILFSNKIVPSLLLNPLHSFKNKHINLEL